MLNIEKEREALSIIEKALKEYGNQVFCGYSGGKDSKTILHLARRIDSNILAVHSEHTNEKCDLNSGVILVKPPKETFKDLIKATQLSVQLDGTTRYEDDKKVIFNKIEIERINIPDNFNPSGVFGLKVFYPILDWKVSEVWEYIKFFKIMNEEQIANYVPSFPYSEIYL